LNNRTRTLTTNSSMFLEIIRIESLDQQFGGKHKTSKILILCVRVMYRGRRRPSLPAPQKRTPAREPSEQRENRTRNRTETFPVSRLVSILKYTICIYITYVLHIICIRCPHRRADGRNSPKTYGWRAAARRDT